MDENITLDPNGASQVCLLWKIKTRLRGTNFCASSAHFALSFERQPNGPKCIQIVQNTPKHEFRVQWVGWVHSLRKIPTRLRGTNFCTSGPFCTECCNATKLSQMHRNSTKCTETKGYDPMGWIEWFVVKNSDTTSRHELLHHFRPFCTKFCMQTNGTKCTQIVRSGPKHYFRSQRGQSGVFVVKN